MSKQPRKYYAAVLKGGNPAAIAHVFAFPVFSMRKQWLTETDFPKGQRVSISKRIANKHRHLEVDFRQSTKFNRQVWIWTYDNIPDWLWDGYEIFAEKHLLEKL